VTGGGKNWRKIPVKNLPGVPAAAFVNDIKADLHDVNTVYIALDNHKFGDLNPYLLKSTDRGKSWKSIKGNIPERTLVWRIVQDHIKPGLLFAGTEFGIYFTIDGGKEWAKLNGGMPVISFRDLAIQRRENDLVGASFGRGFYVFDDYSVLRDVSEQQLKKEAVLFQPRKAWWYIQRPVLSFGGKGSQGAAYYTAPNPPFGAVFTYYLADEIKSKKAVRQEKEKELNKQKKNVSFPGWDKVEAERRQDESKIWLTVKDSQGSVVKRIKGENKKGFHRTAWDLCYPASQAVSDVKELDKAPGGAMISPGNFTITLSKETDGRVTILSKDMPFVVERLREGALAGADPQTAAAFWKELEDFNRVLSAALKTVEKTLKRTEMLQKLLVRTPAAPGSIDTELHDLRQTLLEFDEQLNGSRSKMQIGEDRKPTIAARRGVAVTGTSNSTYGPTPMHKRSMEIAQTEFQELRTKLEDILNTRLPKVEEEIIKAGAPWIEGQPIPQY